MAKTDPEKFAAYKKKLEQKIRDLEDWQLRIKKRAAKKIHRVVHDKIIKPKKAEAAAIITKHAHKAMYNPRTELGQKILKRQFDEISNVQKNIKK